MKRLSTYASLLALALCARSATAGLDLTWNACNTSASGADNVTFDCSGTSGSFGRLFANFQSPTGVPSFLAMDAVLEVRTSGAVPPFWHFETGGCNENGIALTDAMPATECPNATNATPWGPNGVDATAAITAVDFGKGGSDRMRFAITAARAATSPFTLVAGQNYFGFELDIFVDNASTCGGCETPAVIGWSKAVLYGSGIPQELSQSGTRLATVAVNGGIPGPTVLTIRPESGPSTAPASVDLFGRNLVSGTTATLTRSGQSDIAGTGTTTSTLGDLLQTTFDITGKPDGFWNVNVANGGSADAIVNAFRTTGGFTVDSIYPRIGDINTTVPLTIYGSQLAEPASVRITMLNHPDIVGTGTTVAPDGKSLLTTLGLQLADLGHWDVEVTNGDGAKKLVPGGFEVVSQLRVTSVFPNVVSNQGTELLTVGGTGFRPDVSVTLQRPGEPDIIGNVLAVDPLGTFLQANFDFAGRALGLWDLRITNVGGLPVTAGNVLSIQPAPLVTSIEPQHGSNTGSVAVVIGGSGFAPSAVARLTRAGQSAILGTAATIAPDGLSLSTTFDLTDRLPGLWDVEVQNAGGPTGRLSAAFEIRIGLRVTAVVPSFAADTSVVSLTVSGTAMAPGATARLTRSGQSDVVGTAVTVAPDGTSLIASFDLRGRSPGAWNMVVTNPDSVSAVLLNGFTIATIPVVTQIAPASGSNAHGILATIAGSGFVPGISVRLERPSAPTIVGLVTSINGPGTSVSAFFDITGATPGLYDVVVENPGMLTGRLPSAFEVLVPPHLVSVSPPASGNDHMVTLVLSGDHLLPGASAMLVRFDQPPIVATTVRVDPAGTSLSGKFDLRGRAEGPWSVQVANTNGLADTLVNAFLITNGPFITAITPTSGSDQESVDAMISGDMLSVAMYFYLERYPTQINGVITHLNNSKSIDVTFDLSEVPAGLYDLIAIAPSGESAGQLLSGFEVTSAPHIIRYSPTFGYDTSQVVCIVVGRLFESAATATLVGLGSTAPPIVGTGTFVTLHRDTLITTFDLRGQPTGARSLQIVQPGATLGSQQLFTILGHTVVDAPGPAPANVLALAAVVPNPTSGSTTVVFSLASDSKVRVSVIDVMGRELAVLTNATLPAGRHEARWDGRGRQGAAPTGMYFMRMEAAGRTFTKRFVLAK